MAEGGRWVPASALGPQGPEKVTPNQPWQRRVTFPLTIEANVARLPKPAFGSTLTLTRHLHAPQPLPDRPTARPPDRPASPPGEP
jgi:hypothetical protein